MRLDPEDRIHLLEAGTVMMFFTVRAIPETTTAEYGVDLLVMVAVYLYLEVLTLAVSRGRRFSRKLIHLVPFKHSGKRHPSILSVECGRGDKKVRRLPNLVIQCQQ